MSGLPARRGTRAPARSSAPYLGAGDAQHLQQQLARPGVVLDDQRPARRPSSGCVAAPRRRRGEVRSSSRLAMIRPCVRAFDDGCARRRVAARRHAPQVRGPGGDRPRRRAAGSSSTAARKPSFARLDSSVAMRSAPLALERARQRVFRALALVDVDADAGVAEEQSAGGVARRAAVEHPAVFAVAPPQAVFDLEGLARVEGAHAGVEPAREVFGMQRARPAVAERLLGAVIR